METGYPVLRRPKRRLCYITNKDSPPKRWEGTLTLEDVDRIFDDLDSPSHGDLLPPSPLLQTADAHVNQNDCDGLQGGELVEKLQGYQMGPEGVVPHPETRSVSPKLDVGRTLSYFDVPFKAHRPVKTSSPIEQNMAGEEEGGGKQSNEKDRAVSPILFLCEDKGKEEAQKDPLPPQKPQCNGQVTEANDDSRLESSPSKIALTKMSSHKKKETPHKESHTVKEKTAKEAHTTVLKDKRKMPSKNTPEPPDLTARQEPEVAPLEKNSESTHRQPPLEVSTRAGKDMTAFLQKLKDAAQSKHSCSRKSPVKVPTPPPEPEDDFLILEDDRPLWVSIPSKSAIIKKQRHSRMSSTDRDSSEDKRMKDSQLETLNQQQESEKANGELESQAVNQKNKKNSDKQKNKEVNKEVIALRYDSNKLPSSQDVPAGDLMGQEQPKKKKRQPKKVSSKERDQAKDQPKHILEIQKDKLSKKTETKAHKSSQTKKSKSSKDVKENTATHRVKSLKVTRKGLQEDDAVKEAAPADEQSNNMHGDLEEPGLPIDKDILNCEEDGQARQNNHPVVCEGSSSEDCQILGKRKRKQTGEWWLSCAPSTEDRSSQQPTLKKSKQKPKDPTLAVPLPAKAKRERVFKKINQKPLEVLSSHETNKAGKKKTKQSKKGRTEGNILDKMKTTDEEFSTAEPMQTEDQDVPDQDLGQEESSPLVLSQRDHSLNSGGRIFQRVYHHTSNEKISIAPAAPASQRHPKEQLIEAEPAKRRRKAPGDWWMANNMAKNLENRSSQPQQLQPKGPKPSKERKKQSEQRKSPELGVPKNGNAAVSVQPLRGAPVPLLKQKPLFTPKTVKRSLATFKDIFTSVTETPTVVSSRDTRQNNRCKVLPQPAGEISAPDCDAFSKTDADMTGGQCRSTAHNSPHNHEAPQDSRSNVLRSGPSSMIELEEYEDDNMILPSSRVQAVLSASDLCAPPLKPLILQRKDKANLAEWFRSLWPASPDSGPGITPDQFDWYFYQDRAMGFQVDLNTGSFCSGKLLLGSFMKKPLWVDHSATTVFNLLTSSVHVTIDGCDSRFSPGKSFMVQCGHAYSIHNMTAQPAVLYFTRMLAEESA